MTAGQTNLPDTPAPAANAAGDGPSVAGAPRKAPEPATPSRLRLALLNNIASSPSLVTATDFLPHSPLSGKDGKGRTNSSNGLKRPRVDKDANLEKGTSKVGSRPVPTECRDQVIIALDKDRKLYEAKMNMFRDCADAIDKTLQKAGTDLYPYAKEFSAFFADCLTKWLGTNEPRSRTDVTTGPKGNPEKPTYARVAQASAGQSPPAPGSRQAVGGQEKARTAKKPTEDLRIFIRMDNNRLEPFGVKSTLVRRLGLDNQELREVTRCASGFALHPRDKATKEKLLAYRGEIIDMLKAKDVERHVVWYHYKVQGCPRKVMSAEGLTINISDNIAADEVEAQTGVRPVRCALSKNTTDNDIETTWLVSFTQEVPKPFRLFAHSMNSKRSHQSPRINQCEECLRFHGKSYRCGAKTCANCSRPAHEGACDKPIPKCVNCSGPHAATSEKCPARLRIVKGTVRKPTTEQLKEIRLAGEKARSRAFDEARKETAAANTAENREQNGEKLANVMDVDNTNPIQGTRLSDKEADTITVLQ